MLVCMATIGAPAAQAATLGCADDARGTTDLSAWIPAMLDATNAHRATLGLAPLQLDATLAKASTWKARDLAARNYFAHDDPAAADGSPARSPWERLTACGYAAGGSRAENIAAGQDSGTAFVDAWIASPGHRANIENAALRYVGFGVASLASSTYDTYAVQMFSSEPGPAATGPAPTTGTPTTGTPAGEPDRDVLEGGTDTAAVTITGSAAVTRSRCRGRLAVRGWCYQATVRGRLWCSDAAASAGRGVVVSRRTAAGRFVRIGVAASRADGTFVVRQALRPPVTGTRRWLLRNAGTIRVQVAASSTHPASAATIGARVRV